MNENQEIDVRLTAREARALARCANLIAGTVAFEDRQQDERPRACESGAMKIETALMQAEGCLT